MTSLFSAIIPVFNEEKTVGKVIKTLLNSRLVSEVICINDGSWDRSLDVLKEFGKRIILINFKKNQGKGAAVAAGIKRAKGKYLLFCDSDLINFTPEHVQAMIEPILNNEAKVVLAVPTSNPKGKYNRNQVYLAGERVYPRKALLPHLKKLERTKGAGGSEVFLNTLFSKKETKIIPLIGLIKPRKDDKWPTILAAKQYLFSAVGVLQEIGRIEINSPSDLKKLENLIQVDTFDDLLTKIREIKNKKLRVVLLKYFSKYFSKYFKRLKLK